MEAEYWSSPVWKHDILWNHDNRKRNHNGCQQCQKQCIFAKLGWTNTLLPLIIPGCFGNVSIIFFLRQNLIGIPDDLMEAAKLDGCGYFRTFLQIFMPLMKGALATQLMLWFMGIWNDYLAPTIFLRSEKNWTLQVVIRSFNSYYAIQSDFALIMAASVIAMDSMIILWKIKKDRKSVV